MHVLPGIYREANSAAEATIKIHRLYPTICVFDPLPARSRGHDHDTLAVREAHKVHAQL